MRRFDAAIQRLVDKREDALATEFARVVVIMGPIWPRLANTNAPGV
jgi:hypothetical protein